MQILGACVRTYSVEFGGDDLFIAKSLGVLGSLSNCTHR